MLDYHENTLSNYQAVQGYLKLNIANTAAIPGVATLATEFDALVNAIIEKQVIVNTDITGYATEKMACRQSLTEKSLYLSKIITIYATLTPAYLLTINCDATARDLSKMRTNDLYTYAQLLVNEATPILPSLAVYNYGSTDLDALKTAIDAYFAVIESPRFQIQERAKANAELKAQYKEANLFLKTKLDAMMSVFIVTNPSLYKGYRSARGFKMRG